MIQITDAKVRGFLADSKKLARLLSELLRQAWCFATDQEMKGCECRKGHKKSPPLRAEIVNLKSNTMKNTVQR